MKRAKSQPDLVPPKPSTRTGPWILAAIVAAGFAVLLALQSGGDPPPGGDPPRGPDLQRLVGKWQRTNGDYLLTVRGIAPDGKADVAYLNPERSIRVAKAEARVDQGTATLFVEFQDTGYEGSAYTLTYDAQNDVLTGNYFQATMEQNYSVTFVRQAAGP